MSTNNQTTYGDSAAEPREGVLVKCEGFRCLAFRDQTGQWRHFFTGEPIMERVEVVEAPLIS
jgi:hypothetical protein